MLLSTSSHLLRNVNKRTSAIMDEQQGWLILPYTEDFFLNESLLLAFRLNYWYSAKFFICLSLLLLFKLLLFGLSIL